MLKKTHVELYDLKLWLKLQYINNKLSFKDNLKIIAGTLILLQGFIKKKSYFLHLFAKHSNNSIPNRRLAQFATYSVKMNINSHSMT